MVVQSFWFAQPRAYPPPALRQARPVTQYNGQTEIPYLDSAVPTCCSHTACILLPSCCLCPAAVPLHTLMHHAVSHSSPVLGHTACALLRFRTLSPAAVALHVPRVARSLGCVWAPQVWC